MTKQVSPKINGFVVTTPYKPLETKAYTGDFVKGYPETEIFKSGSIIDKLYETNPDGCCEIYKVEPTRVALERLQG